MAEKRQSNQIQKLKFKTESHSSLQNSLSILGPHHFMVPIKMLFVYADLLFIDDGYSCFH